MLTYRSELVVMIISTDFTMEMRYKIIMLRVFIGGENKIIVYNQNMATEWYVLSNKLKNSRNDIAYHWVMEALDTGVINLEHIPVQYNPDNIIAKILY